MSLHLPAVQSTQESYSGSSSEDDEDQTWDDWVSDSMNKRPCPSLFDASVLPSVVDAQMHDKTEHDFDLDEECSRLSLDFHGRARLINYIRKEKPPRSTIADLRGTETIFTSDEYLRPSLEDDPLLQIQSDDWSDDDEESMEPDADNLTNAQRRIRVLEKNLSKALSDIGEYRTIVGSRLGIEDELESPSIAGPSDVLEKPSRDDDSHYFDSYGENDIHAVMIQDKVRTSTYASFILSSPSLFHDAVVLDVGCGTGILSLFAARAGAKRVIAVDASPIAEKAREVVRANQLENVITVIRGKVEDIALPDGITHVDVIISEWMGYGLLYESMLDSVLRARDRFLRIEPDAGVMAPSQCKMLLGLCEASEIFKERVGFWDDVYGFDLSVMGRGVYEDAIVDVVGPDTLVSDVSVIKDLHLRVVTPNQLNFSSPFSLTANVERRTKVHAFLLYFDTFFTVSGGPIPPDTDVHIVHEGEAIVAEVWPVGGRRRPSRRISEDAVSREKEKAAKEKVTSFSTGPKSVPTHWKHTIFLLREPLNVEEGTVVSGTFHCRKSADNSRELDVEIHYSIMRSGNGQEAASESIVQMFKIR